MRRANALAAAAALVAAVVTFGRLYQTDAAGQRVQRAAAPSQAIGRGHDGPFSPAGAPRWRSGAPPNG